MRAFVTRRWLYVGISLISACAFALSVWAGSWWTVAEVQIGPLGSRHCFNGDCRPGGLAFLQGSDLWMRSAVATWMAGFVAMVVMIGLAGAIAAGRVPRLFAKTTLVAIATALVAGGYFVIGFPGMLDAPVSIGQGMILFAIAIPLALVPAIRVLRS